MFVARQLKDKNICEYLLYMWQVEDILRAYGLDENRLAQEYVSAFPTEQRAEEQRWLADLVAMMRAEGCQQRGHLLMNQGTLSLLKDLHRLLLSSARHPFYAAAYTKVLPYIVELRQRGDAQKDELEVCFEALYGTMVLRLRHKSVSSETQRAVQEIGQLLAMLGEAYRKDKDGCLEL